MLRYNAIYSIMPKVSVIIPVYRVERYIEKCCRSLFGQSLDDIEYIFVDDCTPDKSVEMIEKTLDDFPERKEQIKVLHNPTNLGVQYARMNGIKICTGEYVIHCDPDDWVDVTAYEKLYNYAKKNNLDIVTCEFFKIDDKGQKRHIVEPKQDDVIQQLVIGQRQGALWNRMVRGDIVRNSEIIYPTQGVGEDFVLVTQYYYFANAWGELSEPLYYYYQNSESVSSFGNSVKLLGQANKMAENFDILLDFFNKKELVRKYSKEIVARKFFDKRWILPAIRSAKDCALWMNLHPEINCSLFFNHYLSLQDKITSILVECRLYPLFRKILRNR